MTNTITKQFISDNFSTFFDYFNDADAHSEDFYNDFYDEHIAKEMTDFNKSEWMKMWEEDYGVEGWTFEEFINDYEDCKWDISSTYIFDSDFPGMKEKAIDSVFAKIQESWNDEVKQDCFNTITTNNK